MTRDIESGGVRWRRVDGEWVASGSDHRLERRRREPGSPAGWYLWGPGHEDGTYLAEILSPALTEAGHLISAHKALRGAAGETTQACGYVINETGATNDLDDYIRTIPVTEKRADTYMRLKLDREGVRMSVPWRLYRVVRRSREPRD